VKRKGKAEAKRNKGEGTAGWERKKWNEGGEKEANLYIWLRTPCCMRRLGVLTGLRVCPDQRSCFTPCPIGWMTGNCLTTHTPYQLSFLSFWTGFICCLTAWS